MWHRSADSNTPLSPSLHPKFKNGFVIDSESSQEDGLCEQNPTAPPFGEHKAKTSTSKTVSCYKRASRMARASSACENIYSAGYQLVFATLREIKEKGLERAPTQTSKFVRSLHVNRGPGLRVSARDQMRMNHLASLKSKDVDACNTEPAFLLGGYTAPILHDRLAENALKSNAVNSSVLGRKKTQGAANQTTRINCKAIGQTAAAQTTAVALAVAECKWRLRREGAFVVNPLATNSVNLCALALADLSLIEDCELFGALSTVRLVYNSSPTKLTSVSILSTARELATSELQNYTISNAMCNRSYKLVDICNAILGECTSVGHLDAVWSSWALIVYLTSHPRGRDILRATNLTDLDVQSAIAFERYGGEEIRRRARQRESLKKKDDADDSKQKRDENVDDTDEDEDEEQKPQRGYKRKRNTRAGVAAGASDAFFIIEFWHYALQSEDVNVLHTLAAYKKSTARDAAMSTLARQAEGSDVGENVLLQQVSLQNAEKSAQALVSFVGRKDSDVPGILIMRARDDYTGSYRTACGFQRIDNEGASTAIHACVMAKKCLRPLPEIGIAIAWSKAARKFVPCTKSTAVIPTVFERMFLMQEAASGEVGPKEKRDHESIQKFVDQEMDVAMPTEATGTARSFISLVSYMCMNKTHEEAARRMHQETKDVHSRVATVQVPSSERFPSLMGISKDSACRFEPIPTPAPALAVGIGTNEVLRRWMSDKTRKNNPCLKWLGFSNPNEVAKESPYIMCSEPLPLLTITDFEIERVDAPRSAGNSKFKDAKVAIALHVCGDGAVRIPELLASMRTRVFPQSPFVYVKQARAALFVASSQSSFIGSAGSSLAGGYANTAIASSKKISVADVNKLLLLSPMDCYVAGLNNIHRSFEGTCYSGTYGSRVDTGFTPPGLLGHNLRSDNRQHGNCHLSASTANALAKEFAKVHWKTFPDPRQPETSEHKYYSATPTATRGIPHNFIPGVHSALNHYCDFIETARDISDRRDANTVDSIMCLPFSAYSQALSPDLEPSSDASLRTCFREELETSVHTGRAHLVDATPEHWAIVREPLFRRPQQVASGDCPFATCYEEMDTFFNASNTLALVAECACKPSMPQATPTECVSHLAATINQFVNGTGGMGWAECSWAADALLLLNCLYPSSAVVGELALLAAFAKAAPALQQRDWKAEVPSPCLRDLVEKDEYDNAVQFWSAFNRGEGCAWTTGIAPLLTLLLTLKGTHKTSPETVTQVRSALETAVRAVWLVHSEDGIKAPADWSPASSATSPSHMARHHIDPVFVGDYDQGILQRGAIVGLKGHSYRQVLAEMLGAHLRGVECNVYQNSGGMSLRVSSDPTILQKGGSLRTDKSISPTQTEGDEMAYGTRKNKIIGARAQKYAWDGNALLGLPLYTAVEAPRNRDLLSRGEFGYSSYFQPEQWRSMDDNQLQSAQARGAKVAVMQSANPTIAKMVNPLL